MAAVSVYRGGQLLRRVELGESPLTIGRAPENGLVLEDQDKGVSRTHAEIRLEDGLYIVEDLNSQNGVWLGERRVTRDVLPADVPLTIGPYRLVLEAALAVESLATDPLTPTVVLEDVGNWVPVTPSEPASAVSGTGRVVKTRQPRKPARLVAAVAIGATLVVGLVVAKAVWKPRPQPVPPPTVEVSPAVIPASPTPRDEFQTHFDKAKELIAKGDKAAAKAESTRALALFPLDPEGLAQQSLIEALPDPTPAEPGADDPAGKEDNGGASPGTAPPAVARPAAVERNAFLTVPRRSDETPANRVKREKDAKDALTEGIRQSNAGNYEAAIRSFRSAISLSGMTNFGSYENEAQSRINDAVAAQQSLVAKDAADRKARALVLVADARRSAAEDVPGAIGKLRTARGLDAAVPGLELLDKLQAQAAADGKDALGKATVLDAFGKPSEAVTQLEIAVQLLSLAPGSADDLADAKRRLQELKNRR